MKEEEEKEEEVFWGSNAHFSSVKSINFFKANDESNNKSIPKQKRYMVSGSLCSTSFLKVKLNDELVVTAQKLDGDVRHRAWCGPCQIVSTSFIDAKYLFNSVVMGHNACFNMAKGVIGSGESL